MTSEKTKKMIASAKEHVAMARKTITGANAHVAETKQALRFRGGIPSVTPKNAGFDNSANE